MVILFFCRQGFRMITLDRQAGPFQNFNRSQVMKQTYTFFASPTPPPPHPPPPPPPPPPAPPPHPPFFLRFKTPGTFLSGKKFQLIKTSTTCPPPPPPTPTPPPSPQNTHLNPCAIIHNPNNCSVRYRL